MSTIINGMRVRTKTKSEPAKRKKIHCQSRGRKHDESLSNCCWIECKCGKKICGRCGSSEIVSMPDEKIYEFTPDWCHLECADCGLEGCGQCE